MLFSSQPAEFCGRRAFHKSTMPASSAHAVLFVALACIAGRVACWQQSQYQVGFCAAPLPRLRSGTKFASSLPDCVQSPSFVPARNIVPALGPSVSLRSRGGRASTICMSGAGGEPNLMNQELYTEKAFEALQRLPGIADNFKQQFLEVDLLLYSLLQDETCQRILSKAAGKGAFSSLMQQMVRGYEEHLRTLPSVTGATGQQKVAAPSLTAALKDANSSKMRLKDDFISVEHMLMACVKEPRIRSSGVLQKYGISDGAIETAVEDVRKGQRVTSRNPEATYEALNKYGRDLTEEAKAG